MARVIILFGANPWLCSTQPQIPADIGIPDILITRNFWSLTPWVSWSVHVADTSKAAFSEMDSSICVRQILGPEKGLQFWPNWLSASLLGLPRHIKDATYVGCSTNQYPFNMIITYHHQFAWFLPDYILITSMFWKSTPFGLFTCNMDVWWCLGVLGLHLPSGND